MLRTNRSISIRCVIENKAEESALDDGESFTSNGLVSESEVNMLPVFASLVFTVEEEEMRDTRIEDAERQNCGG